MLAAKFLHGTVKHHLAHQATQGMQEQHALARCHAVAGLVTHAGAGIRQRHIVPSACAKTVLRAVIGQLRAPGIIHGVFPIHRQMACICHDALQVGKGRAQPDVGVAGGQQRALPRRQRAVLPALTRWPALITRQVARVGSILHRRRLTRQGGRSLHLQQRPEIVNQWLHGRVVPAFLQDGQPQRPHGRAK